MPSSRLALLPLLLAALAHAQPQPPSPELKEKAAQYLATAAGMAAAGSPEFQPGALLQLGVVHAALDKTRAVELIGQSIAAAAALPTRAGMRIREEFLAMATGELAKVDLERAIEQFTFLTTLPAGERDPRIDAYEQLVTRLIESKQLDRALELLQSFGAAGSYPYAAAGRLLRELPEDDDRRVLLFSQTIAAFQQQPDLQAMEQFTRQYMPGRPKAMPPQMFDTAVRAMLRAALDNKGVPSASLTITAPKGTISLHDPQDAALFSLIDLVQRVDPSLVKSMVAGRDQMVQLIARYPNGQLSLDGAGDTIVTRGTLTPGQSPGDAQSRQQRLAIETMQFQQVMTYYRKDPARALEAARAIPTPRLKVRAISTIAVNIDPAEPAQAKSTVERCMAALAEMPDPSDRASGWATLANGAGRIPDLDLAVKALERGLADARALYKSDADPDNPNLAPRPSWPSAAVFKSLFFRAAMLLGAAAESLLEKIPDPEIATLARIEMAAAWLGANSTPTPVKTDRKRR